MKSLVTEEQECLAGTTPMQCEWKIYFYACITQNSGEWGATILKLFSHINGTLRMIYRNGPEFHPGFKKSPTTDEAPCNWTNMTSRVKLRPTLKP